MMTADKIKGIVHRWAYFVRHGEMKRIMSEIKPCDRYVQRMSPAAFKRESVTCVHHCVKRHVDVCDTIVIDMYNNTAVFMACLLSCSCLRLTFGPVTGQPSKYLLSNFLLDVDSACFAIMAEADCSKDTGKYTRKARAWNSILEATTLAYQVLVQSIS